MSLRKRLDTILNPPGEHDVHWVEVALFVLIVTSAVVIALETMPELPERARLMLHRVEYALALLFAVEYCARLFAAPCRWRYALSFWGIIDLLSVLPLILFLFPEAAALKSLRLLRVFRILKLLRGETAFDRLVRAVLEVRHELTVFLFISLVILYLAAVGIYHFEHDAQPDAFSSIPASLWWAVASLTTVGYGDIYPITAGGRAFTTAILFIGLGVVAVPVGLITSALTSERPQGTNDPDDSHE